MPSFRYFFIIFAKIRLFSLFRPTALKDAFSIIDSLKLSE